MKMYLHDRNPVLEFKLIGALEDRAVAEFESAWVTACSLNRPHLRVDLSGLAAIDREGTNLIERMQNAGARLVASPPFACLDLLRSLGVENLPLPASSQATNRPTRLGWLLQLLTITRRAVIRGGAIRLHSR